MKKTTLAVALALAGFTSIASAAPQSNAFYVGGKLGWSKYFNTKSERISDDIDSVKTNDFGAGTYLGYQVNPYVALELGFDYLGQMKYKDTDGDSLKVRTMGTQLSTKLSYPLGFIWSGLSDLDMYARGGLMVTYARVKADDEKESKTDVAPVFALGFDYKLTDKLSTRLEYQWVQTLDANVTFDDADEAVQIRPDNGLLSVGVTYSFGSMRPAAPAPAVVASRPMTATIIKESETIELSQDVLFAFGKDTLHAEGKKVLNNLVSALSSADLAKATTTVIGHSDRIGAAAYNLKLSQQRADVVKQYLVSKGIPANMITTRGVGQSEPVTGNQCDAISDRSKLIACLAPDRRVVIEVTATQSN